MSVWIRSCGCAGSPRSASSPRFSSWRRGWNSIFPSFPASPSSVCRRWSIWRCRSPSTRCSALEPVYAAALLALNIVELAGLLFLTGGLQNPFSFLFLAPVLISATALPVRLTIALGMPGGRLRLGAGVLPSAAAVGRR